MQSECPAILKAVLGFLVLMGGVALGADRVPIFWSYDWDDNIFVMPTRIYVRHKQTHALLEISTAQWALMRDKLGKDGGWKNFELFGDVKTGSKRFLGDFQQDGINWFERHIQRGLNLPPEKWQGPEWLEFVASTATPALADHVTIVTGRMHDPHTMEEGLEYLRAKRGLIHHAPLERNLYPVANPKITPGLAGTSKSPADAKAKVIHRLLDGIEAVRLDPDAPKVLGRENPATKAALKLWSYTDDDYKNFETVRDDLSKFLASHRAWPSVKILITYTGPERPEMKSRAVVLLADGRVRGASDEEREEPMRLAKWIARQSQESAAKKPAAPTH
jgi:hypothetical protein